MIEHGGNVEKIARQLGINAQQLIDFSANINPLGIPPQVKERIGELLETTQNYPDIEYTQARTCIAEYEKIPTEWVHLANGAAQAFFELAQAIKPQQLLILAPTFSEYRQAFESVGTIVTEHHLRAEKHYQWEFSDLLCALNQLKPHDVVLICNPNNPTGSLVNTTDLQQLADYAKTHQLTVIFDEAFMDFVTPKAHHTFVPFLVQYPHVVVVKSLTKFFAVPGLRLGYVLSSHPTLLKHIQNTRVAWSVNGLAAGTIPLLLNDDTYHQQTYHWLSTEKNWLYQQLMQFPQLNVIYPSVNYIFFECTAPVDLAEALLLHRIMIRSCQNYTQLTANHYRIAIKTREANQLLIKALQTVLTGVSDEKN